MLVDARFAEERQKLLDEKSKALSALRLRLESGCKEMPSARQLGDGWLLTFPMLCRFEERLHEAKGQWAKAEAERSEAATAWQAEACCLLDDQRAMLREKARVPGQPSTNQIVNHTVFTNRMAHHV